MKRILRHGLFLAVAGTIIMTGCQSQNEGQTSGSIVAEENGSTGSTETVIIGNGDSVTVTGTGVRPLSMGSKAEASRLSQKREPTMSYPTEPNTSMRKKGRMNRMRLYSARMILFWRAAAC